MSMNNINDLTFNFWGDNLVKCDELSKIIRNITLGIYWCERDVVARSHEESRIAVKVQNS